MFLCAVYRCDETASSWMLVGLIFSISLKKGFSRRVLFINISHNIAKKRRWIIVDKSTWLDMGCKITFLQCNNTARVRVYNLGRAKIFWGQGASVHSIFWGKTWVQKRFQVNYLIFNGAPRASKSGCFGGHFRCATARLWRPRGSIKYQVNYLNSLMHSRFAPKNWMHIGYLTPKKFHLA